MFRAGAKIQGYQFQEAEVQMEVKFSPIGQTQGIFSSFTLRAWMGSRLQVEVGVELWVVRRQRRKQAQTTEPY